MLCDCFSIVQVVHCTIIYIITIQKTKNQWLDLVVCYAFNFPKSSLFLYCMANVVFPVFYCYFLILYFVNHTSLNYLLQEFFVIMQVSVEVEMVFKYNILSFNKSNHFFSYSLLEIFRQTHYDTWFSYDIFSNQFSKLSAFMSS